MGKENYIIFLIPKKKEKSDNMCDENKCGPEHKEMGEMHGHMKGGHMHHEMKKEMIMKKIFIKKIMEHLSEADKKKILVKKMDMKISMAEQKAEIMKEKKKLISAKLDMEASMAEQKIEMIKMIRDMLKEE